MKTITQIIRNRILFTGILFLLSTLIKAEWKQPPDSIKYDINDPRNPNCPCHKYQKLADEEYARLLKKNKKEIENSKPEPAIHIAGKEAYSGQSSEKKWSSRIWSSTDFRKRRKNNAGRKKQNVKRHNFRAKTGRTDSCFHW